METDEKLKERISLLIRFFWLDDLFKIGTELNLGYFKGFSNYWETNQYQAATEIARNIDDDKLISLTKEHLPKYGLTLGGFHGKYYTATQTGELKLESSWDLIRVNVHRALKKWGDKAYGVLQALVNRNGRATFVDLIDEIEKVLGYEFIPSYLLPRLAPFGLVFKSGSNKYPDWTMPSEIISVVQEELRNFKRPSHPMQPRVTPSERLLKVDRMITGLVDEIVQTRANVNLLFEKRFGIKLFRQNEMATNDIRKPCSNEEDFNNRIMSLALLISEVELGNLQRLVGAQNLDPRSINLFEVFLSNQFSNYDKGIIKNLRIIVALRSKKYPVHTGDPEFIDALNYLGITNFPPDWQELWEVVLSRFLDSLKGLISLLLSV